MSPLQKVCVGALKGGGNVWAGTEWHASGTLIDASGF